ncbi:hypothetical protein BGP77_12025 [Saccharospirillum sp. MSK14-1]|nr:hypothetical protein BGP77_12025 [Saccharospirillum sp. MSK14-1]
MIVEEISKIEILENGEMYLVLSSGGKEEYHNIYREAAEVYWDRERKAFKAPTPRKWSHVDWYKHIVSVAASGLRLSLQVSDNTIWVNVPEPTKSEILGLIK